MTFALAMRGGHGPEVDIAKEAFAIHGGHDIDLHHPIRVGLEYRVRGRVDRIFDKTGRSGPLTIVSRHVRILAPDDVPAVEIHDRQVIRWKPSRPARRGLTAPEAQNDLVDGQRPALSEEPSNPHYMAALEPPPIAGELEIGDTIGPTSRSGPSAGQISAWASALRDRETLFHDRQGSKALGFADLVVPGPMQSAFIDDMLRRCLPGWQLRKLSMTFRQSLTAGEPIEIQGVIIDASQLERTCDLVVINRRSGEITSIGTAVLQRG